MLSTDRAVDPVPAGNVRARLGKAVFFVEGNTRVKQVDVQEQVEKVGDDYVATIVLDRFQNDKCQWANSGLGINFFHNNYLLSGRRCSYFTSHVISRTQVRVGNRSNGEETHNVF